MPTIAGNVAVAANTRSANVIAGESFEFLGRAAIVSVYTTGSAVGLEGDFLLGGNSLAQGAVVPGTNRSPLREEDGLVQGGGLPGERIFLQFLNTTGAAITANWIVDITFV